MPQQKRVAQYNREADKKYLASLTPEQKAEKNRRAAYIRALNFIKKEKYTNDEFKELSALIKEKEKLLNGTKK